MKHRMVWKLLFYFGELLFMFSALLSVIFILLYQQEVLQLHKEKLTQKAWALSEAFTLAQEGHFNKALYSEKSLEIFDRLLLVDVWVADEKKKLYTHGEYAYDTLPINAETMIDDVLQGKTVCCEAFSKVLGVPTLTVGVPVYNQEKKIICAVLLHAPIKEIKQAISDGFLVLGISIFTAFIFAIFLSARFSFAFIQPLEKMRQAALKLANGDYTAKTGVKQKDELGQLAAAIDILSSRLYDVSEESARLEQLKNDFMANISHELRTPVTVLRGSLEALRDGIITGQEQITQYHKQMLSESLNLERLVNDFLELSRLQNVDFKMEMAELNVCEIVSDLVRSMKRVALKKKVRIEVETPFPEFKIWGDYGRIRQMLVIVMDNAIKFSREGQTVWIHMKMEEKNMCLSVTDNGCGISADELPYIFDRFHKTSANDNKGGSGLGLAIAKQIAQRHQIAISVESIENEKTEFKFLF